MYTGATPHYNQRTSEQYYANMTARVDPLAVRDYAYAWWYRIALQCVTTRACLILWGCSVE